MKSNFVTFETSNVCQFYDVNCRCVTSGQCVSMNTNVAVRGHPPSTMVKIYRIHLRHYLRCKLEERFFKSRPI
ncbi:hypothetical protein SNEBB_007553 [Seison nebaliae]|nr:hypothetical protein SNEBB_007553 [Seison nebaliae]